MVQPRLNVANAVLADLKCEPCDCLRLGLLLEEEKRLLKGIKMDARYNKTKTADVDGGAIPYWFKHVLASAFNVSAILQASELRAAVEDAPGITSRNPGEKKVVVVRAGAEPSAALVAWAHTRSGPDVEALAAAFLAAPPAPTTLSAHVGQGVILPKDELAELTRKARAPKSEIAEIAALLTNALTVDGITTPDFTAKDVAAIGEAASL
ncbi:hypothetical protein STCU_06726 [Strigomonas culicis]|uniref:Uncharacterized protein n=1 Tax=Strigomonas culicis TaxID=28005 RepID=S9U401_9TRYP|nr:hypothetical protein STCU_06726 [Strigomonas culicis]|eukprot:EPY25517.1 hypothetical protein STCU_06726 [Strigomonas culicis]